MLVDGIHSIPSLQSYRPTDLVFASRFPGLLLAIPGIKVVKPSFDREVKANELKVTWLGHAVRRKKKGRS